MTAPHSNKGLTPTEQHHRAAARRDRIALLLTEIGPMKLVELLEATGEKESFAREDLAGLMKAGRVSSVRVAVPGRRHVRIAIYSVVIEAAPEPGDEIDRKTLTEYPLHHVRDPLVAALFGART